MCDQRKITVFLPDIAGIQGFKPDAVDTVQRQEAHLVQKETILTTGFFVAHRNSTGGSVGLLIDLVSPEGQGVIDADPLLTAGSAIGKSYFNDACVIQLHFHTRGCLFQQDIQNGIPELSLFDDEILHEDEVLSRFQILQQPLVHILAQREIFLPGTGVQVSITDFYTASSPENGLRVTGCSVSRIKQRPPACGQWFSDVPDA